MMNRETLFQRARELSENVQRTYETLPMAEKRQQQEELQALIESPTFWDTPEQAQATMKEAAFIEKYCETWDALHQNSTGICELLEMAEESDLSELETELKTIKRIFTTAEEQLLFTGQYDTENAIIRLQVGNGGQDAEDFCQMLFRMYARWAEAHEMTSSMIESSESDVGLRSATIEIKGDFAYGLLQAEHGVHRLIRMSPFNAKGLRQTSFARVEVLPVLRRQANITLNPSDLRIDVFRSSGPGGQSVNTTDSAVRITYLPLNLTVTCQNEKSQLQNKESAMKVLTARLVQLKLEQQAEELSELRGEVLENSFGSQIRTYTLQPYKLVKDHRTDTEHTNPDKVFDGEIDVFTQSYLRWKAKK